MESRKSNVLLQEKWNAYSHALGLLLGLIGFGFLLKTSNEATLLPIVIYSITVILLFSASTLYHAVQNPRLKRKLRIVDHISIYYLIAGTYTPVCMLLLQASKGGLLLYLVWGLALFGTFLKLFFTGKFEVFSLVLYGIMGWLIVIDIQYLIENTSTLGLVYLAMGGFFYTIGIVFYAVKKIPFNHLIWHIFVLGGAISHWLFVYCELTS